VLHNPWDGARRERPVLQGLRCLLRRAPEPDGSGAPASVFAQGRGPCCLGSVGLSPWSSGTRHSCYEHVEQQ